MTARTYRPLMLLSASLLVRLDLVDQKSNTFDSLPRGQWRVPDHNNQDLAIFFWAISTISQVPALGEGWRAASCRRPRARHPHLPCRAPRRSHRQAESWSSASGPTSMSTRAASASTSQRCARRSATPASRPAMSSTSPGRGYCFVASLAQAVPSPYLLLPPISRTAPLASPAAREDDRTRRGHREDLNRAFASSLHHRGRPGRHRQDRSRRDRRRIAGLPISADGSSSSTSGR